jgi:hypothetical protein
VFEHGRYNHTMIGEVRVFLGKGSPKSLIVLMLVPDYFLLSS